MIFAAVLVLAACGRKGPPKAPELSYPGGVRFLSAIGKVDSVMLRWGEPAQELSSTKKPDVARYEVKRALVTNDEPGDFTVIAELDADDVQKNGGPEGAASSSPTASLPATAKPAKSGASVKTYLISDTAVQTGAVYDYEVLPVTHDGDVVDPQQILRVTFRGESSVFQARPVNAKKPKATS